MLAKGGDDPARLGPYRVRAVIGHGGMGRVYLATSPAGRAVAVKVIRPGLADEPGYRERFAREARAAMAVSGVYTASVVDSDTTGELPYLATEYVPAPSLNEVVQATGALGETTVRALGAGLAEALAAIHRAGLVHRDLKPHNVLLARNGPVVIDFGIARADVETALTDIGATIGTPGYIAPEVLHGQSPSPASDVFSLGCVLVYAARGYGPYGRGEPLVITHRIAHDEPDLSNLPDSIRFLVQPVLGRDPSRRPTPAQLLEEATRLGGVTLHDGLWLPDEVRTLLDDRRSEVQALLREGGDTAEPGAGPAGAGSAAVGSAGLGSPAVGSAAATWQPPVRTSPPPVPLAAPPAGEWRAVAPTESGYIPQGPTQLSDVGYAGQTSASPASAPSASPIPSQSPPSQPAAGRRRPVFAYATAGIAVVVIAAVALIVLHNNGSPSSSPAAAGSTTSAIAGSSSSATAAPSATSAATSAAASAPANVPNYKPGTYPVNQVAATDLLGNTATVDSVTVAADHSVSVKLTYTNNSGIDTQWSCSGSTVGEATLKASAGGNVASTGSDCTKDPSKTWDMPDGGTIDSVEYFASGPPGTGDWTFAIDSEPEFVGSTAHGFTIPTS